MELILVVVISAGMAGNSQNGVSRSLNIQKKKSPGGNTINYRKKPTVHLSSIQCCIMCANDTRSGPLLKKLLEFITFETSE